MRSEIKTAGNSVFLARIGMRTSGDETRSVLNIVHEYSLDGELIHTYDFGPRHPGGRFVANIFSGKGQLYAHVITDAVAGVSQLDNSLITIGNGTEKKVCRVPFGIEAHGIAADGRIVGRLKWGGARQDFVLVPAEP
jgi:hypothetical protein